MMCSEAYSLALKERLSSQLDSIELLRAMYPGEDELMIDDTTKQNLDQLRQWTMSTDESNTDLPISVPSTLSLMLKVKLEDDDNDGDDNARVIQLNIEVPITTMAQALPAAPLHVRLRQPDWLSRSQTAQINSSIPTDELEDVVSTIEYLRDATRAALPSTQSTMTMTTTSTKASSKSSSGNDSEYVRVWFYFPSLSTRAKRTDLVRYADSYNLTGFVLAGKPGILCLEGSSGHIDEYMRVIKTESWGDIPSHQKKVSERYREAIGSRGQGRAFQGMQEITEAEWMGAKRGERGNRSDMKVLEGWLVGKGLAGSLEKVLQM